MNRIYLFSSLVLLLVSCAPTHPVQTTASKTTQPLLLGQHPRSDLEQQPFARWFDSGYAAYNPDTSTIARLTPVLKNRTIEIFMGTWCSDSRREVPRMFKILDACQVPEDHIRLIMVDYRDKMYKRSPGHEEAGLDIIHVPDLLVLDQGKEQGRIVESPVTSLEKDLEAIAKGECYEPQYKGAYWLSTITRQAPLEYPGIVDSIRAKTKAESELYILSYILLEQGDTGRALLVARLNTLAYPNSAAAYTFMGKICDGCADPVGARRAYRRALELDPGTKSAKEWLDAHP